VIVQAETMVMMEQIEMTEPMTESLAKRLRTETMVLTQQMEMTELMTKTMDAPRRDTCA
jgi:hypothetical protein